ncbi:peptidoglycan-binding domain-containing protein [Streptomyces sp. NPDC029003]|uniref:peptidoglycan-binding domain-containing protein n=1 Tax=Streptomyces sp. NPDC029003 TaxID=3155125 RepID=UPI0033EBD314
MPARRRGRGLPRGRQSAPLVAAAATALGAAAAVGALVFSNAADTSESAGPSATRLELVDPSGGASPDGSGAPSPAAPGGSASKAATGPVRPGSPPPPAAAPSRAPDPPPAGPSPVTSGGTSDTDPAPGATTQAPPAPPRVLERGSEGPQVLELQARLARIGLWPHPQRGRYDRTLEDAVADFQADRRIRTDPAGVYGAATRRALEALTR